MIVVQARYRYRIEPTGVQREMLARTFGCCRVVFNDAIRTRETRSGAGEKVSPTEVQHRVITRAKTTPERAWLGEVASVALVQSVRDAHRAYQNFFNSLSGKRKGRKVGKPRFKSRKDTRQSFRLTRNGFTIRPNGRLYLAKVGDVRVRWSRDLPSEPSSVTIIHEPDGHYYACFVVEVQPEPLPETEQEAGVDLGITRLATIADTTGTRRDVPNPQASGREATQAGQIGAGESPSRQRRQEPGQSPSKGRHPAWQSRPRPAGLSPQAGPWLVRENQAVYVEDLNIAGMVSNSRLARAIHDAGWGQFVRLIEEKAERYGRIVHPVSRWLPSVEDLLDAELWACDGQTCRYRSGSDLPGLRHHARSR